MTAEVSTRDKIIFALDEAYHLRDLMGSACSNVKDAIEELDRHDPDYDAMKSNYDILYRAYLSVDELVTYLS